MNKILFGMATLTLPLLANSGDVSFTPTGFKMPIMKITISKSSGSVGSAYGALNEQVIFKCASTTEANCLIDITDPTALATVTAATGATVPAGTYDQIGLYDCADGDTTTTVYLKGSFTPTGGSTYYTDPSTSNTTGVSSSLSAADFTPLANYGCSTKAILLSTPITVTSTSTVNATLLVDNTDLAYSTSATSPGMGGCKAASSGNQRGVCIDFPVIIPYVSTSALSTTTTKRFKIAWDNTSTSAIDDTKANAIVIVPMVGTTPLMAYTTWYYSNTSASPTLGSVQDTTYGGAGIGNATDPSSFKVNADGSIAFTVGGSQDVGAVFTAFQLSDHKATATTRTGTTWYYHAIPF